MWRYSTQSSNALVRDENGKAANRMKVSHPISKRMARGMHVAPGEIQNIQPLLVRD